MAIATAEADIQPRLGRELTGSEATIVGIRLDDAERLIRARIPDMAAKITAGTLLPTDVAFVEAEAVLRLLRNPDGFQSESDGSYSYTFDYKVASGRLMITDEEWALLGIRAGVTVIKPKIDTLWCSAEGTTNPQWAWFGWNPGTLTP